MSAARSGLVLLATIAAGLTLAPAATADHVAPSVSATLTLGKATRQCNVQGVCSRARRATVSWNASCGPAAPAGALESVEVGIFGVRRNGTRFAYDGEALEDAPPASGSMGMTAGPGLRFFGEVSVTCDDTVTDAEGNQIEHRATATSATDQVYLPPQLVSARTTRSGFCGVRVPARKVDRWLQAGQYAELAYTLSFSSASLMRAGVPSLRQIKLFARGAGIRLKRTPDRGMFRDPGVIGTWLTPRRGGTLRVWATIAGRRTNTLRIRVLPRRC
jgi:hypothetical protein